MTSANANAAMFVLKEYAAVSAAPTLSVHFKFKTIIWSHSW